MNELTLEWIQKAESDFIAATELFRLGIGEASDAICFHCQQCAEKYTKAYLHHQGAEFPRTHNLTQLLVLCEEQNASFKTIWPEMRVLNTYGVEVRYPGSFTTLDEAKGAVTAMQTVRSFIRSKLGLDTDNDETGEHL